MRSFTAAAWTVVVVFGGGAQVASGAALPAPTPAITPAPSVAGVEAFIKRDDPDAVSLAKVLLTAIPFSLQVVAATNLPALSTILWHEFLDDNKPAWFKDLPTDVQSYLVHQFGPSTAWLSPTATSTNSNSEATTTSEAQSSEVTSTVVPSSSSIADTSPPPAGLTHRQKIGLGVGIPLAFVAAAALLLGCCVLFRRRQRKSVNGSQPPSSPGFIPHFAFYEKSEHHTPLNGKSRGKHISQDTSYSGYSNWDDDVIEPTENTYTPYANEGKGFGASAHSAPIPAPPSYHTHTSNRARGTRTSYSSLHSVAEVHEPDEMPARSRDGFRPSPPRRSSYGLVPGPAQTKRKPVPSTSSAHSSPRSSAHSSGDRNSLVPAAAAAAVQTPRPVPDHSNSSSTNSTHSSLEPGFGNTTHTTASSVSPFSDAPQLSTNPFSNDYQYVEDYGPEYTNNVFPYNDLENGLYGGHTELSRYPQYPPEVPPPKSASRTEWPLRNAMGRRRDQSPLWDRVYGGG